MSRLLDDFDPSLVPDDGPPTRDIKPPRPLRKDILPRRHPDAKTDLDITERVFDPGPLSPAKPS